MVQCVAYMVFLEIKLRYTSSVVFSRSFINVKYKVILCDLILQSLPPHFNHLHKTEKIFLTCTRLIEFTEQYLAFFIPYHLAFKIQTCVTYYIESSTFVFSLIVIIHNTAH